MWQPVEAISQTKGQRSMGHVTGHRESRDLTGSSSCASRGPHKAKMLSSIQDALEMTKGWQEYDRNMPPCSCFRCFVSGVVRCHTQHVIRSMRRNPIRAHIAGSRLEQTDPSISFLSTRSAWNLLCQ